MRFPRFLVQMGKGAKDGALGHFNFKGQETKNTREENWKGKTLM